VREEIASSAVSIGFGMAAATGGIALTMLTSGVIAVVGGAAMIGAGSSLVMNPIQKKIAGERMTFEDSLKDVALGATIGETEWKVLEMFSITDSFQGAFVGPTGAGGSALAKGGSDVLKCAVRMGAGSVAGMKDVRNEKVII
jgi:hypothetical protein